MCSSDLTWSLGTASAGPVAPSNAPSDDYRLGPLDIIAISVLGVPEFAQPNKSWMDVTVSNSGKIHLPYVGVMKVTDMTTRELRAELAARLHERGLLNDPQVTVRVTEYRASTIYVLGEVLQPGQYYMRENMYMLDLLGLTLGFPTEGLAYLYRRSAVTNGDESGAPASPDSPRRGVDTVVSKAIPIDLQALTSGTQPELNLKLQSGDVLYVPYNRPKYYYVTGEVSTPGAYEVPPARPLMVSQAIALSGGPARTAKTSEGILVRFKDDGTREEIGVDFRAIMRGKKADFPIQANDIIFIPGSNAKTLGYGVLTAIPSAALAVIP